MSSNSKTVYILYVCTYTHYAVTAICFNIIYNTFVCLRTSRRIRNTSFAFFLPRPIFLSKCIRVSVKKRHEGPPQWHVNILSSDVRRKALRRLLLLSDIDMSRPTWFDFIIACHRDMPTTIACRISFVTVILSN